MKNWRSTKFNEDIPENVYQIKCTTPTRWFPLETMLLSLLIYNDLLNWKAPNDFSRINKESNCFGDFSNTKILVCFIRSGG
jgi:hypothetical protein